MIINKDYVVGVDVANEKDYSAYIVSVKNEQNKYENYQVNENVYKYIIQLETYIKTGKGCIKEIYKERFNNNETIRNNRIIKIR